MADDDEIANVIPLLLSTGKRGNINLLKKTAAEYGDKLPVDGKDGLGNTALHYAAYASHLDVVKELVSLKASLNIQNLAGDTPLHKAVDRNNIDVIKFLLSKGASPDVANKKGAQPITLSRSADIRKLLKEKTHQKELESIGISTGANDDDMLCNSDDDDD